MNNENPTIIKGVKNVARIKDLFVTLFKYSLSIISPSFPIINFL